MLEYLKLENVGPAPRMEVEFAPRVNLMTGDNGLGKSFLLDTAWWALTGYWPAEVNRRMTSGLVARPRDPNERSSIAFRASYADETVEFGVGFSPGEEAWTPRGRRRIDALIVYAHADGSFSVWDSARNNWPRSAPPVNPERRPPYVFTETEVWDGLAPEGNGRTAPLCNGLLHDWSSWVKSKDAMSRAMASALRALSPDWADGDRLEPGPPMRLSIDDARDIPSIPVRPAEEPLNFDADVRRPGLRAIAERVGEMPPRAAGRRYEQVAESREEIRSVAGPVRNSPKNTGRATFRSTT